MTPASIPELDTPAFRRALAAALGLPSEHEAPRRSLRAAPAWDPLGSVEEDRPLEQRRAA